MTVQGSTDVSAGRVRSVVAEFPLMIVAGLLICASALFISVPSIDLRASALFFENGFPARQRPELLALREVGFTVTRLVVWGVIAAGVMRLVAPTRMQWIDWRVVVFVGAVMMLGPGLLGEGIMKPLFGRARPIQTVDFGGAHLFTPAWAMADACTRNCSFISGEASAAFALLSLAMIAPRQIRRTSCAVALLFAIAIGWKRLAFGAHFLSDIVVGWCLVGLLMIALHRLLFGSAARPEPAFAPRAPVQAARVAPAE